MYRKLEDFIEDWTQESEFTLKVFSKLTDESLSKKVNDDVRTAGRLAWHITTSMVQMGHHTGLKFKSVEEDSPVPATAKEIVSAYKEVSENMIAEIKKKWNDETLNMEDDMFSEKWKRGMTLAIIISHQIHHRAQLTVVMRLNGLKVPGVFGPAKEEWVNYGMPAQE